MTYINDAEKYDSNNLYIWNGTEWYSTPIEINGNYANFKKWPGLKVKLTNET